MNRPPGYNPMTWDCNKKGCFNIKRRPKLELFAGCFPRRTNFGDVDGLIELNGAFALLEWKGDNAAIRAGQAMSMRAFTLLDHRNVVFIVNGDAETMDVTQYALCHHGKINDFAQANLDDVCMRMHGWAEWACATPGRRAA